jgi:AGZA family xanthine/uracil permease-like MFS transporter
MAIIPSLAAWGKLQIDNALGSVAGIHHVTDEMIASMAQTGILYKGLSILGGGSILAGVVLGAITVYIVDRKFMMAGAFALAGGVLTFFGLMHGEAIGINQTPTVALAYLVVGGVLVACAKFAVVAPSTAEEPEEAGDLPALAAE